MKKSNDAIILKLLALEGHEDAQKLLAFNYALPSSQMDMMKHGIGPLKRFDIILKEVIADV